MNSSKTEMKTYEKAVKGGDNGFVTRSLISIIALMLALVLTLSSCGSAGGTGDSGLTQTSAAKDYNAASKAEMFTDRDLSSDYDESGAVKVTLSGTSANRNDFICSFLSFSYFFSTQVRQHLQHRPARFRGPRHTSSGPP